VKIFTFIYIFFFAEDRVFFSVKANENKETSGHPFPIRHIC